VFLLFWGGLRKFISGNPTMVMDGDDASSNSLEEVLSAVCVRVCVFRYGNKSLSNLVESLRHIARSM
jgi:hypothetical protein